MSLTKAQLDAIQPGDTLAVSNRAGVYLTEVDRLTKTMIVLKNGVRFNRESGYQVGGTVWEQSYLNLPDHPQIVKKLADQRRDILLRNLERLVTDFRRNPTSFNLTKVEAMLEQVKPYLED